MDVTKPTLTEFLQHSGRILPELEQKQVVLRRRAGSDIVVLSGEHWQALSLSLVVLAGACRGGEEAPGQVFGLPWMALLLPEDRQAFLSELSLAAVAALESGRFRELAELMSQWRATALATWDEANRGTQPGHPEDAPLPLARP